MAVETIEIRVSCDECADDDLVELTSLTNVEREFERQLELEGWEFGRHRKYMCPDCVAQEKEREQMEDDES